MHRAFPAVPPAMQAPDGTPTNAAFGFWRAHKFIEEQHPDAIVCAFDKGKPAFRMEALEQYKAQRPPMDDNLRVQFPLIEDLLAALNIPGGGAALAGRATISWAPSRLKTRSSATTRCS